MAEPKSVANENGISRDRLAQLLNEDLSREYQAIIAYVLFASLEGRGIHEHRRSARRAREARAAARADHFPADRLSGRNAHRKSEGRADFGKSS